MGALELLVEAAQRRPLVAADEERGRQAMEAIETPLGEQEPHYRLYAREEDRPLCGLVTVADADGPKRRTCIPVHHPFHRRDGHPPSQYLEAAERGKYWPYRCFTQ
jgi:hypothetical protein